MFCDHTTVTFTGGKGGDGMVSFRREKYVAKGGPDGGDGGRGANVILQADRNITTLSELHKKKHYKAPNGGDGWRKNQTGKTGEDLIIKVPVGTMVFRDTNNDLVIDLKHHDQTYLIAKGGKGGLGNARFTSSIHQAPKFAELGEKGSEIKTNLELKLVADVGIIGLPSAGKSTLISVISNAKPKIAAYHFTTLIPNLGMVEMNKFDNTKTDSFVIADIPGLIPGAHEGKGLGHEFLRHISRTHILVHLLDGTLTDITRNYDDINNELAQYDKALKEDKENKHPQNQEISKEEQIVVINKTDSIDEEQLKELIAELEKHNPKLKGKIHTISAITGEGIKELIWTIYQARQDLYEKLLAQEAEEEQEPTTEHRIFRPHIQKRSRSFRVELITTNKEQEQKTFKVSGQRIEQIVSMTDFTNIEGIERIYRYMTKVGIEKALKRQGAQPEDQIQIGEKTLVFRR